jgi:hypothetical protein
MVSLTRHSRESGKPVLQGSNRWPWTAAFARFRGVTNDHHLLARVPHRRPQGLCRNPNSRNDDDHLMIYDAPLFAFRGICASADLRPGRSRLCAAARPAPSLPSPTPPAASPGRPAGLGRPGIPLNTNGGGLSYMHSGMYALQESGRQMRGTALAQSRHQDLGLPRRRRHVRRKRHHHHVERGGEIFSSNSVRPHNSSNADDLRSYLMIRRSAQ